MTGEGAMGGCCADGTGTKVYILACRPWEAVSIVHTQNGQQDIAPLILTTKDSPWRVSDKLIAYIHVTKTVKEVSKAINHVSFPDEDIYQRNMLKGQNSG